MTNINLLHPADQICNILKRLYDTDLTTLTGGNVSIRDDQGIIWVSPTGIDKGSLKREDIVRIMPDDTIIGKWKPTSEYRIHVGILRTRPEIKAIVHAHSPALVTMSAIHKVPDTKAFFPAYTCETGTPGLAEYGMPGTLKLVQCVMDIFKQGYDAAILKNHAAFVGSRIDLNDAFAKMEQLDLNAKIQLIAESEAELTNRSEDEFETLKKHLAAETKAGTVKKDCQSDQEKNLRCILSELSYRAYRKRLFSAHFGTISARVEGTSFLITPFEKDNAYLTGDDFVLSKEDDCEEGKTADAFRRLHSLIYRKHPEINAIIMAAPACASAYAVTKQEYEVALIPESYGVLRSFAHITFNEMLDTDGWELISDQAGIEHTPYFALDNIGIMVMGDNPLLTFDKLEVAEGTALSIHYAKMTGQKIKAMTESMKEEQDSLS